MDGLILKSFCLNEYFYLVCFVYFIALLIMADLSKHKFIGNRNILLLYIINYIYICMYIYIYIYNIYIYIYIIVRYDVSTKVLRMILLLINSKWREVDSGASTSESLAKNRYLVAVPASASFKIKWKSISEQIFSNKVMSYIIFCEPKIKKWVKRNSSQDSYFSRRFLGIESIFSSQSWIRDSRLICSHQDLNTNVPS